jgi:hypothetical protein
LLASLLASLLACLLSWLARLRAAAGDEQAGAYSIEHSERQHRPDSFFLFFLLILPEV